MRRGEKKARAWFGTAFDILCSCAADTHSATHTIILKSLGHSSIDAQSRSIKCQRNPCRVSNHENLHQTRETWTYRKFVIALASGAVNRSRRRRQLDECVRPIYGIGHARHCHRLLLGMVKIVSFVEENSIFYLVFVQSWFFSQFCRDNVYFLTSPKYSFILSEGCIFLIIKICLS